MGEEVTYTTWTLVGGEHGGKKVKQPEYLSSSSIVYNFTVYNIHSVYADGRLFKVALHTDLDIDDFVSGVRTASGCDQSKAAEILERSGAVEVLL